MSDDPVYDVAVVGGGPAGATIARLLAANGLRTVVVEASETERWKPGEVLPPEANPVLARLGLSGLLQSRPEIADRSAGTRSLWGGSSVDYRDGFRESNGAGWIICRPAFESALRALAITENVDWKSGVRFTRLDQESGLWRLSFAAREGSVARSRFIVDATGRAATVARRLGARRVVYSRLMSSVLTWPTEIAGVPWLTVENVEGGWWYAVNPPGGEQVVARFHHPDAAQTRHGFSFDDIARTNLIRSVIVPPAASPPDRCRWFDASSVCLHTIGGAGWLAVGDAAAAFDPVSAQGLHSALASAEAACHVILAWMKNRHAELPGYAQAMSAAYDVYLSQLAGHYRRALFPVDLTLRPLEPFQIQA